MSKILCILAFGMSFVFNIHAAEHSSTNGIADGIGIGGTVFQTWGLNYRKYFNAYWGVSANVGGWITHSLGNLGTALGGSYTFAHHSFDHSKKLPNSSIRIYGIAYLAAIYGHGWLPSGSDVQVARRYFDLGFGVGPGAEFFFNRHFSVHAELPWMTFFRFSKSNSAFDSSHPHFGGGITYYF